MRNPWSGLRGLPAPVWTIAITTLVNRAGTMVLPFLVLYLTKHLGVPASLAGIALTAYGLGGIISAPLAGRLVDRVGAFAVMRASLACSGVILLTLPLAHDFRLVLLLVLCWAIVGEANRPASLSALTHGVPTSQRKAAVALNRLAINLGMSIGPAIGGFLAVVSFPLLFVVDGVTAIAASALLTMLVASHLGAVDVGASMADPLPRAKASARSAWHDRRARPLFIGMTLLGLVFFQHEAAMSLYIVRDLHFRESFYGTLFAVNTLLIVAVEVPLNLAMSRWPHRRAVMLGALLFAVGFGSLAFVTTAPAIIATIVIWTFGEMILFPVSAAYVADVAPAGRSGAYMGAYSMTISIAMVIGPWLGAAALDRFGPVAMWSGVFLVGLVAVAAFGAVARDTSPAVNESAVAA